MDGYFRHPPPPHHFQSNHTQIWTGGNHKLVVHDAPPSGSYEAPSGPLRRPVPVYPESHAVTVPSQAAPRPHSAGGNLRAPRGAELSPHPDAADTTVISYTNGSPPVAASSPPDSDAKRKAMFPEAQYQRTWHNAGKHLPGRGMGKGDATTLQEMRAKEKERNIFIKAKEDLTKWEAKREDIDEQHRVEKEEKAKQREEIPVQLTQQNTREDKERVEERHSAASVAHVSRSFRGKLQQKGEVTKTTEWGASWNRQKPPPTEEEKDKAFELWLKKKEKQEAKERKAVRTKKQKNKEELLNAHQTKEKQEEEMTLWKKVQDIRVAHEKKVTKIERLAKASGAVPQPILDMAGLTMEVMAKMKPPVNSSKGENEEEQEDLSEDAKRVLFLGALRGKFAKGKLYEAPKDKHGGNTKKEKRLAQHMGLMDEIILALQDEVNKKKDNDKTLKEIQKKQQAAMLNEEKRIDALGSRLQGRVISQQFIRLSGVCKSDISAALRGKQYQKLPQAELRRLVVMALHRMKAEDPPSSVAAFLESRVIPQFEERDKEKNEQRKKNGEDELPHKMYDPYRCTLLEYLEELAGTLPSLDEDNFNENGEETSQDESAAKVKEMDRRRREEEDLRKDAHLKRWQPGMVVLAHSTNLKKTSRQQRNEQYLKGNQVSEKMKSRLALFIKTTNYMGILETQLQSAAAKGREYHPGPETINSIRAFFSWPPSKKREERAPTPGSIRVVVTCDPGVLRDYDPDLLAGLLSLDPLTPNTLLESVIYQDVSRMTSAHFPNFDMENVTAKLKLRAPIATIIAPMSNASFSSQKHLAPFTDEGESADGDIAVAAPPVEPNDDESSDDGQCPPPPEEPEEGYDEEFCAEE